MGTINRPQWNATSFFVFPLLSPIKRTSFFPFKNTGGIKKGERPKAFDSEAFLAMPRSSLPVI